MEHNILKTVSAGFCMDHVWTKNTKILFKMSFLCFTDESKSYRFGRAVELFKKNNGLSKDQASGALITGAPYTIGAIFYKKNSL